MANNVKIELTEQPGAFDGFSFKVFLIGDSYEKTIAKVFTSMPMSSNQVKIEPTLSGTIQSLFDNLSVTDADEFCTFSLSGDEIYLNFNTVGDYGFVKNLTLRPAKYTLSLETFDQVVVPALSYFPYKSFAITIVDTYENDRVLLEEFTQIQSPTLSWDGGDDLYQNIRASELNFNMQVVENIDAKFKHLFTGDEKRYLTKVFFVNADNVAALCWQGYLLPDQFKEPYKNGVNFIEFTATDMIGSLKGKYLEPWFYVNRLPIAELFAAILKLTGLNQEILVKPSILPATRYINWKDINVNLQPYFDGKKYTDVYQILQDVLEAQALTIYSYKGFWHLEGITRRKDTNGSVLGFSADGIAQNSKRLFSKNVAFPMFERNVPVFTGITPWKSVNVTVSTEGDGNVFSDSVLKKDIFLTTYYEDMEVDPSALTGNAYRDSLFKDWTFVGCPNMIYRPSLFRKFSEKLIVNFPLPSGSFTTEYTTAYSLANYLVCPESPYLLKDNEYELVFEAEMRSFFATTPDVLQQKVDAGVYDGLFRFNCLLDGVSIVNNVPELSSMRRFVYDRQIDSSTDNEYDYILKYKISVKFRINVSGNIQVRFLHPTFAGMPHIYQTQYFNWTALSISSSEGYEDKENVKAIRPINFTQEYDADLKIISTTDYSVENSFGLGFPINQPPYLSSIGTSTFPAIYNDNQYFPTGNATVQLQTFESTSIYKDDLFIKDFRRAVFKQTAAGIKSLFGNLWVRTIGASVRFGYLLGYTGSPLLPKSFYKIQTLEPGDVLKFMQVKYGVENYKNRSKWRLSGDGLNFGEVYNRAFAKAIHSVHPETLYRLEGKAMDLIFPDVLIGFYFDNENRQFIPTSLTLDLTSGKTQIVATENKFSIPNDLTYE